MLNFANITVLDKDDIEKLETDPRFAEAAGLIMRSHMVFKEFAPMGGEFRFHACTFDAAKHEIIQDVTRLVIRKKMTVNAAIDHALSQQIEKGSEFACKQDVDNFVASVRRIRALKIPCKHYKPGFH